MLSGLRFLVFCSLLTIASAHARQLELGSVDFPTSGSGQAQKHFLREVAALHSFWYPVALEEFRAATAADPDFMMGYWGEAMAHDHPIWGDPQETEAARKVIAKIRITPGLTQRERAYIDAAKLLYGEGDRQARDQAYAEAMKRIYREYPDDLEAAGFYSLALLGSVEPQKPAVLQTRMRAAGIAMEVYRKEPNHPGAAHYILHAFGDSEPRDLGAPRRETLCRNRSRLASCAAHAFAHFLTARDVGRSRKIERGFVGGFKKMGRAKQYEIALLRHEDRAHSLIGSARAAAKNGDRDLALAAYSEFVRHWKGDKSQPGSREAQDFVGRAR